MTDHDWQQAYNAGKRDAERELVEALAFYADPETYHACSFYFDRPTGGWDDDFEESHGHPDYERAMPGKLARYTLFKLFPEARVNNR